MQIVVAGKAHPQDADGKDVMQRIVELSRDPAVAGRVVFLENYDLELARTIIPGCDIWLNTPRRPHEASGTSGMKAAVNGVPNLSVLDGWWAEAYDGLNGFAIGDGITHVSVEEQDRRDAASLYETLENMIIPTYYERDEQNVPRGWVERMKRTMRTLGWRFNTDRMVIDYTNNCYLPAAGAQNCRMP